MRLIKAIFFPPPESSRRRKILLPVFTVGVIILIPLLAIPPIWEYTNTPAFCGTTCHTMPPEYNTYLISPHARVPCVDCHIGRDLLIVQFVRKSGHLRLLADTILGNYEYPIRVGEMRPARETCELCHFPEKFSDDSLRIINHFQDNRTNDPYSIALLMHTGGGSARQGLGKGIHWHVENKITFITLDPEEQEIPWVKVENADGTSTVYNAINSPVDVNNLDQYTMHEMDCITCHNRISHEIPDPVELVDGALEQGDLSRDIPFIRQRAVELLSGEYVSSAEAEASFATLDQYYHDNYSDFYTSSNGQEDVQQAIALLDQLYTDNTYPEQKLDYRTHPDNIGHLNSPGCFRCHDGEHFSQDGQVIRLECNLCHSIPQIVKPGEIEPELPLTTGIEPTSHLDSTWIARHHLEIDATCSNCHTTGNPGGTDDSSFCSNSACHGVNWRFAGFNAPGLAELLGVNQAAKPPLLEDFTGQPTYEVLQPMFEQICGGCHGPVPTKGLQLTTYAGIMAGSEDGPVIVPGSPDQSMIIDVLTKGHFAKLTSHQMDLLTQWIADGAPEQ